MLTALLIAGYLACCVAIGCLASANSRRSSDRDAPVRGPVVNAPKQVRRMSLREFRRRKASRSKQT